MTEILSTIFSYMKWMANNNRHIEKGQNN